MLHMYEPNNVNQFSSWVEISFYPWERIWRLCDGSMFVLQKKTLNKLQGQIFSLLLVFLSSGRLQRPSSMFHMSASRHTLLVVGSMTHAVLRPALLWRPCQSVRVFVTESHHTKRKSLVVRCVGNCEACGTREASQFAKWRICQVMEKRSQGP